MWENSFELTTTPSSDGVITQELVALGPGDVRQTIMRQVMDTSEQQIRDALIALGWTPPSDSSLSGHGRR